MRLVWQTVIRTIRSRSEVYQCLIVKASDLMLFAMLVARSTIALLPFFQGAMVGGGVVLWHGLLLPRMIGKVENGEGSGSWALATSED